MDLVCPECLGTLIPQGEESVRCSTHGGEYKVLFSRQLPPALTPAGAVSEALGSAGTEESQPPMIPASQCFCTQHPRVQAAFLCRICGKPMCWTCAFREPDGTALCPECFAHPGVVEPSPPPAIERAASEPMPAGAHCIQHPQVAATQRCRLCGALVCDTCDFVLPGNVHVCPTCASKPRSGLSPKRKKLLIGSLALALWTTVGMTCLLCGAFAAMVQSNAEQEALGMVLMLFVLFPAVVGLGLGISVKDRRLANPPSIWIAIIWNAIMVGSFVLLMIIGILSKS